MRYFDDFHAGDIFELGEVSVSADEIVEFARRYDPQPIHIDPEAAARGQFGGIIASGWQTAGLFMSLFATEFLNRAASLVSPGVEELRWLRPVRPGDVLRGRYEILEARPSGRDPGRGTLVGRGELLNGDGEAVFRLVAHNQLRRRS